MSSDREKHKVITRALRGLPPGETVRIPKRVVRRLPRSYEQTLVGTPPSLAVEGGREQYRGPWNRHVVETADSWVVHRDTADPRQDPVTHLVADVPDLAAAGAVGTIAGLAAGSSRYRRDVERGVDERTAKLNAAVEGLFVGAVGFTAGYAGSRLLRWLARED